MQQSGNQDALGQLITSITREILNPFIILVSAVAVLYFVWGVLKFVKGFDDDTSREDGRRHMIWGIIGISVMILTYVIINVIANIVGVPRPY